MIVCTVNYSCHYAITGSVAAPRPKGPEGRSTRIIPIEVGYTYPYRL